MLGVKAPSFGGQYTFNSGATPAAPEQPWGGGMLAPPGGYPTMTPNTPERNGMESALNYYTTLSGPQLALLQQQAGTYAGQLGATQAQYDLARQGLQSGAANDLAKINLGPEYDAIQRGANARGLEGLNAQDKLAWEALGNQFEGFDLRTLQSWQNAGRNQFATKSEATPRGSVGSVGYKQKMTGIQQDLANQLTGIGIDKDSAVFGAREAAMGRTEQKAKINDNNAMLDIKAKEYGIDRAQVESNLQQGLAKLGIDQTASVGQIMDMLASNDVQQRALGEQIFRDAIGNSDFFTTLPQNTMPTGRNSESTTSGNAGNPITQRAVDEFMRIGAQR